MSSEADLRAALQLLQETADYLERLPTVPATHHLAARLRRHLAEPTARAALVPPPPAALQGRGPFTPAGLPLLQASITGDGWLTVGVPEALHGASRDYALRELLRALKRRPISLHLRRT
jgi:hypothetical protein